VARSVDQDDSRIRLAAHPFLVAGERDIVLQRVNDEARDRDLAKRIQPIEAIDGLEQSAEIGSNHFRMLVPVHANVGDQRQFGRVGEQWRHSDIVGSAAFGGWIIGEFTGFFPGLQRRFRRRIRSGLPIRHHLPAIRDESGGDGRQLDQSANPARIAERVDKGLHARTGPADQRDAIRTDSAPNSVQVHQQQVERYPVWADRLRFAASARIVGNNSAAHGQRVQGAAVVQREGRDHCLGTGASDAEIQANAIGRNRVGFGDRHGVLPYLLRGVGTAIETRCARSHDRQQGHAEWASAHIFAVQLQPRRA
jgi:hypothetical protein